MTVELGALSWISKMLRLERWHSRQKKLQEQGHGAGESGKPGEVGHGPGGSGFYVSTLLGYRVPRYLVKHYSGCVSEGILDETDI